ncbi:transmembrane protein 272-like [Ornithodoros turicata]|uniref:transmembrane protein 272-like n=1 Tax=Ornithodoros turicata TaxID=34597 RepID=UPI00313A2B8F
MATSREGQPEADRIADDPPPAANNANVEAPREEDATDFVTPPPYSTLSAKVKEARQSSTSTRHFLGTVLVLFCGTVGLTYLLVVTVVIPIVMVVIGSYYLNDCPIEKHIPIYLVTGGVVGVVKLLLSIYSRCTKHKRPEHEAEGPHDREAMFCDMVLNCFLFGWYIAGCVWIFGAYLPDFSDPGSLEYCNKTLYYFAFAVVASGIIFLVAIASCACCVILYHACCKRQRY